MEFKAYLSEIRKQGKHVGWMSYDHECWGIMVYGLNDVQDRLLVFKWANWWLKMRYKGCDLNEDTRLILGVV